MGHGEVGGIVGYADSIKIFGCYNIGNVLGTERYIGGIVGFNTGDVCNSYNLGIVESKTDYVGGISGNNSNDSGADGIIENTFNFGKIKGNRYVGGITGENKPGKDGGVITNSYNKAIIEGNMYLGGIAGNQSGKAHMDNCYYLKGVATGGVNGNDIDGQAEPLEESQMPEVIDVVQSQVEIDGQTVNVWKEDTSNINNGYPILFWQ